MEQPSTCAVSKREHDCSACVVVWLCACVLRQDPMYNLGVLAQLTAMAAKQNQREQQLAMESLKDLYLNNLLPDRALVFFSRHPPEVSSLVAGVSERASERASDWMRSEPASVSD